MPKKKVKLIIKNVGQGNMNIVYLKQDHFVLFDMGSKQVSLLKPKIDGFETQVNRIRSLNKVLSNFEFYRVFVLSHWDLDHYNGLLCASDNFLNMFNFYLLPKGLPTITSQDAYDRLPKNKVLNIPMRRRKRNSASTQLKSFFENEMFNIYRGTRHYNRNKSGLVLKVKSQNSEAYLTGDISYDQINDYMYSYTNKNMFLVVPHHGGNAGDHRKIHNWVNLKVAIISNGYNQWNHPLGHIIKEFKSFNGVQIFRTDNNADYIKNI